MLDELNDARNELNIVVLDACRDNPFPWKRSGSRGLQVVGNQPSDSIIVFATSAGSTAADGTGSNGLFTSHLLSNLKKPGLEVNEVFRLTMGDVVRASGNQQRPAIYSQFSGLAYLGGRTAPSPINEVIPSYLVDIDPSYVIPGVQTAQFFYDRGVQFFDKKDYETAIADFTEAIRLDPNYKEAYKDRGRSYGNKNDYDRAIADYTQAIRIDPNYKDAHTIRGNAYYFKRDIDLAIADYTNAIRIDPNYAYAYYSRGNMYYLFKRDYDSAIADYEAALKIDPNDYVTKGNLEGARKARGW
jgi:tetratricopeptide (TPR) repeat protein